MTCTGIGWLGWVGPQGQCLVCSLGSWGLWGRGHWLGLGYKRRSMARSVWATLSPGDLWDNVGRCQTTGGV